MKLSENARATRSRSSTTTAVGLALLALFFALTLASSAGGATTTTVPLGTADGFAVLAGTPNVTDVPTSAITGDVGLSPAPGSGITGLTCAEVTGTIYATDATGLPCFVVNPGLLTTAKSDVTTAYLDAAGRTPDTTFVGGDNQLGGQTLVPGVYSFGHATTANLIGNLTLSGDSSSVWIFQASSDLVTASSSTVTLTGGARACNVFWQVSSSATLNTSSTIQGTILALTSITVAHGATVDGRLLARNGKVTLDTNTITRPGCAPIPDRQLYCDPSGKAYDLVTGEDKVAPYNTLGLVPAYLDPVTGSASCNFPATATTPTSTTPTPTTPTPTTPTPTTPKPTPTAPAKPPAVPKPATGATKSVKGVKAASSPSAATSAFGLTG